MAVEDHVTYMGPNEVLVGGPRVRVVIQGGGSVGVRKRTHKKNKKERHRDRKRGTFMSNDYNFCVCVLVFV